MRKILETGFANAAFRGINEAENAACRCGGKEGYAMKDTIKIHSGSVRMIAHRGLSGIERENTCAAFVAAGNRSYYGIETDVHRTADGKYIIIHDDDTKRVAGTELSVEETDFDTLRALRMKDLSGFERADLIFPSLEEYIMVCRYYGKVSVLELKNHFEPQHIQEIIDIVRSCGWLDETIFISFDLENMIALRAMLPGQKAQYLTCEFTDDLPGILKEHKLDLDIHHRAVTKENVALLHSMGIEVNVWTVDTVEDAQRVIACGVNYLTSNILE